MTDCNPNIGASPLPPDMAGWLVAQITATAPDALCGWVVIGIRHPEVDHGPGVHAVVCVTSSIDDIDDIEPLAKAAEHAVIMMRAATRIEIPDYPPDDLSPPC